MKPFKLNPDLHGDLASMTCKKDERGVKTLTGLQSTKQKPSRASRKSLDELQAELARALNETRPCSVRVDTDDDKVNILVALTDYNPESLLDTRGVLGGIKRMTTPSVATKYNNGLQFETTLITRVGSTEVYDFNELSRLFYKVESTILKCSEKFPLVVDLSETLLEIKRKLDDAVKNTPELASFADADNQALETYKIDPEMESDAIIYVVLPEPSRLNGLPSAVRLAHKVGDFSIDYFVQLSSRTQDLAAINLFFKTATDIVWNTFNSRVFDNTLGEPTYELF